MKNLIFPLLLFSLLWAGCSGANPQHTGHTTETPLTGPTWRLVAFGEAAGEAPSTPDGAEITATFDAEEGRVAGSAGCNRYFGRYETSGDGQLSFSQIGATKRACAQPVMEREQAYLDALNAVRSWERSEGRLTLLNMNGQALLRFAARASGSGAATESAQATLDGTVTYRPRIALSPEAVVRVRLVQAGRADDPARTLAERAIPTDGRQVPVPFSLSYAPVQVEAGRRYLVEAEIRSSGGAVQWTTEAPHPVLTQGAPSDSVEVVVVQTSEAEAGNGAGTQGALVGPTWRLARIEQAGGDAVEPEARADYTITFQANGRYGGRTDCNRHGGDYEAGADGAFGTQHGAGTTAACGPNSLDRTFLRVLGEANRYAVQGGRLRLETPGGAALVFERAGSGATGGAGMQPQRTGETFVFDCDAPGSEAFSFTTRTGPGELAVWLPERFTSADAQRYLVLGQVRAASGAKYEGDGVTVWTKGDEALLTVGGETFTGCAANRQASVWEDARLSGWDVRAVGQEPGWELLIREGERIRFVYDYGEREVVTPAPEPTPGQAARRTTYRAETEAHRLTVTLTDESCTDAMSGERFPLAVTVQLDGETYRGCGRTLD